MRISDAFKSKKYKGTISVKYDCFCGFDKIIFLGDDIASFTSVFECKKCHRQYDFFPPQRFTAINSFITLRYTPNWLTKKHHDDYFI